MDSPIVLVTSSVPVRDVVERTLARLHTGVRHEMGSESGIAAARESGAVVICSLESDWRFLIQSLGAADDIAPPVILLAPETDPAFWAHAMLEGAFDVVSLAELNDRLPGAVEKARARWLRARLVRQALQQNSAGFRRAS